MKLYIANRYLKTNFYRPDFRRILSDTENEKIKTIIVKEMNRFGREYLKVGILTELKLPEYGVRL